MMSNNDWKDRAACATDNGALHEIFFGPLPDPGQPYGPRETVAGHDARVAKAAEICGECPVRIECEQYALRYRSRFGIWNGKDGEELQRIQRRRRASRARERKRLEAEAATG